METIRFTTDNDVKVTLHKQFLDLIEEVVEIIEAKEYDNEVSIFYDDYALKSIRFGKIGIIIYYTNEEGKEIHEHIRFSELADYKKLYQ